MKLSGILSILLLLASGVVYGQQLVDGIAAIVGKEVILKSEVEQLEKNILYFKTAERMREDREQTWAEEVRHYYTEHNNKYKELNKEVKKIRKEMNEYN